VAEEGPGWWGVGFRSAAYWLRRNVISGKPRNHDRAIVDDCTFYGIRTIDGRDIYRCAQLIGAVSALGCWRLYFQQRKPFESSVIETTVESTEKRPRLCPVGDQTIRR